MPSYYYMLLLASARQVPTRDDAQTRASAQSAAVAARRNAAPLQGAPPSTRTHHRAKLRSPLAVVRVGSEDGSLPLALGADDAPHLCEECG